VNRQVALAVSVLALPLLGLRLATAQQAPAGTPAAASPADNEGLEEVVVTAERRTETAQRAPIAISTLSAADITNANITRPGGLTDLAPALQVSDDTGPYSIFYVRGVGNFAANGLSDAALSFNFDGVTVSRSGTSGFFYDLERVEVLKGPQGTLYGRNATGGAINVISKAPVLGDFQFDGTLQGGNYTNFREDAMVNLPFGDSAALRVAAFHTQRDGYMSDGTDSQNDTGARLSFLVKATETLKITLVGDYFKQGGDLAGGTVTGVTTPFDRVLPTFSPSDRLGFFSPQVAAYIQTQKDFLNGANFVPFQNVNHEDNRFWGIDPTIEWKTPVGTLTVIPAYRDSQVDYASFATGVLLRERSHDKQTTVEARLASDNDQALRYVLGAFYLDDANSVPTYDVNQQANATFQSYRAGTISRAAFANLSYAIVPDVRVSAGLRETRDDKNFAGTTVSNTIICKISTPFGPSCPTAGVLPYTLLAAGPASFPPFVPGPDGTITVLSTINDNNSASYSKLTWHAGADWEITRENLLYASVDTGFKSGGFFFSADANTFRPETITAFSVGSKNRFLDNRLQANLELYYWKYHDQQISHLSTDSHFDTIFPTENVGAATFKGIELDLQARPLLHTTVSADIQYNDGVYNSFVYHTPNNNGGVSNGTGCPNGAAPGTTYTVDCSGKQPPYAPKLTLTAGIQQIVPLPGDGTLVGNGRVHYQSTTLTALEFLSVEQQPGYAMWDFDLTYNSAKDRFFVGAYVDNAFNKTALSFSFGTPFSQFMTATLQPPRVYGVRIGVHL
jgi:iron complex outermembrane recepter protein